MTNYICINGNKTELTEEQLRQLGIEVSKANPFAKVKEREWYHYISCTGAIESHRECGDNIDEMFYKTANYCTDKSIMEQRALNETLNRLLWRYSMEHDGDKIDWDNPDNVKWCCWYDHKKCKYDIGCYTYAQWREVIYFNSQKIAEAAIKEIIEPFMKEHPEFKW